MLWNDCIVGVETMAREDGDGEGSFYSEVTREKLVDDGELNPEEDGFMQGYLEGFQEMAEEDS